MNLTERRNFIKTSLITTMGTTAAPSFMLDKNDRVLSNPGGTAPIYMNGELQLMVQEIPFFKHRNDVLDEDKNIYVCQWNANRAYPLMIAESVFKTNLYAEIAR